MALFRTCGRISKRVSEIPWGQTAEPGLCAGDLWNSHLLRTLTVLSGGPKDYQASTQLEEKGDEYSVFLHHSRPCPLLEAD